MENCKYLNLDMLQRMLYSLDLKLKLNGHDYLNATKPKPDIMAAEAQTLLTQVLRACLVYLKKAVWHQAEEEYEK